jgi:hypothetical protein
MRKAIKPIKESKKIQELEDRIIILEKQLEKLLKTKGE